MSLNKYRPKDMNLRKAHKILNLVTDHFKVSLEAIRSYAKPGPIVKARHAAMYLLYKHAEGTQEQCAELLNKKNHSTVIHAVEVVEQCFTTKQYLYDDIQALEAKYARWLQHPFHQQNNRLPNFTMKSLLDQKVNKHLTAA